MRLVRVAALTCALAMLAAAGSLPFAVLDHVSTSTAVFTNAGLSNNAAVGARPTATFATWLDKPIEVFSISATSPNATRLWVRSLSNTNAAYDIVTAGHVSIFPAAGLVDTIVAEVSTTGATPTTATTISGYASTVFGESEPVWTKVMHGTYIDAIDADADMVDISDDGSTVALSAFVYTPSDKNYVATFFALDAQTGAILFQNTPVKANAKPQTAFASINGDGTTIVFVNGEYVYVYDREGSLLCEPIVRAVSGFAMIDVFGVYLLSPAPMGVAVSAWNGTGFAPTVSLSLNSSYIASAVSVGYAAGASAAARAVVTAGELADGDRRQALRAAIEAAEREAGAPLGYVAVSWLDVDNSAASDAIASYALTSGSDIFTYLTPVNVGSQTVAGVVASGSFIAACTWGDTDGTAPTILLFDASSSSSMPLFGFHTPGSMFAIGMYADVSPDGTSIVYLAAAGKHVPASQLGNGGDAYLLAVTVSA